MHRIENGRRAVLAKIHIIKQDIGMSEEDYRHVLHMWTGKESCIDMDRSELGLVLERMRELMKLCGSGSRPRAKEYDDYPSGCSRPQWRKIRWLQREIGWKDAALRGYIRHVTGLDHERFLDVRSAREVIAGLYGVLRHTKKKRAVG